MVEHADGCRLTHQHRQQVAERGRRFVELDRGLRQEERLVESLLADRLDAEALSIRGRRSVASLTALVQRHHTRDDREREQRRKPREQSSQTAVGLPLVRGLVLGLGAALADELPLQVVQLALVAGAPVEGRGQAGAR